MLCHPYGSYYIASLCWPQLFVGAGMLCHVPIYMEHVQDLLKPESGNLAVRESTSGFFVAGLSEHKMSSAMQVIPAPHRHRRRRVERACQRVPGTPFDHLPTRASRLARCTCPDGRLSARVRAHVYTDDMTCRLPCASRRRAPSSPASPSTRRARPCRSYRLA